MESPTLEAMAVNAEVSEFFQIELEAFVEASKRQRPNAWALVERLQQVCRAEAPATVAGLERSTRTLAEPTAA